jgi:tripeptidyl-peptidase I
MRFQYLTVAALGALPISSALPSPGHSIHEKRDISNANWVKRDRIEKDIVLPVRIGLSQSNLDDAHKYLMEVSDPKSKNFGKHWTAEEVNAKFAPSKVSLDSTVDWLAASGISRQRIAQSENKGWLAFDATAEELEGLLDTEFYNFEHSTQGHSTVACDDYKVPRHIQRHVDYITPGVKMTPRGQTKRMVKRAVGMNAQGRPQMPYAKKPAFNLNSFTNSTGNLTNCDTMITPECIRALYNIPKPSKADPSNALGVFESGTSYSQQDLDSFFTNFAPHIPNGTHPTNQLIDGAVAPSPVEEASGEANLDFDLAYPLVYPQNLTLFQADDPVVEENFQYSNGIFNTFLDAIDGSYCKYSAFNETGNDPIVDPTYPDTRPGGYNGSLMCGTFKPTNVISISYGTQEIDLPVNYQKRQCNEFLKLGLQGITVVLSTGDSGVEGRLSDTSNGTVNGCIGPNKKTFNPTYPANCPWITTVGATSVPKNSTVSQPEVAANDPENFPGFFSSGGFSNIYKTPFYQADAVAAYFANFDPGYNSYGMNQTIGANNGLYNRQGRAYPDVAANGDKIAVYSNGQFQLSAGTSASTPIFASVINLINEERLAAGLGPLGFINPALYANPGMLNDIVSGNNPGCGTKGFSAVQGWDPVTGLGTPNYPSMLAYFMSLP